jgi:hypothetical protein
MRPTPPKAKLEDLARALTSAPNVNLKDFAATRRGLLLAPLLAALPAALIADPTHAIDPETARSPPSSAFSARLLSNSNSSIPPSRKCGRYRD